MRKVLLNKSHGKESVNNTNTIPVELNRDVSLFHDEIMADTVDTMQVYNDEKDKSTKHRFIFTLYPVCSNPLFNNITEIVYNEGASDALMLKDNETNDSLKAGAISTQKLNRIQAIRNTEYSNDKFNLTYHCGADIFNNHLLRAKENISVQRRASSSKKICRVYDGNNAISTALTIDDAFNTIGDYSRNSDGKDLYTYFPYANESYIYKKTYGKSNRLPLYMYDTIYSFTEAYKNGIIRKDGWLGFNNPTTFHIPVSGDTTNGYYVNKCINNKEGCEFIQMAPEKDLFYFTPKKNPHRKRLEYNWDYFLTYPAVSVYNDGVILIGKGEGLPLSKFTIIGGEDRNYLEHYGANGLKVALFRSPVRHNLKVGDFINLKFTGGENIKCKVSGIGDFNGKLKDRYFSVRKDEFIDMVSKDSEPKRFAKVVNGFQCEYYFRKFKKFNGKYKSTLNRLAFANTVYGDEVSQLVYTDDLDIDGYVDNLGRPLTEVYLTILKTNRGYTKWYQEGNCRDESVEYSHVFGSITSGIDMPSYAGKELPTLRFQHNIPVSFVNQNDDNVIFPESSPKMETGIVNGWDTYFGDLVEFNPVTVNETTLEIVKHRFNTAQREINSFLNTIYYDEIAGDDYDAGRYGTDKQVTGYTIIRQYKMNEGYANIAPEGYIYVPHHKIKIREFDNTVKQLSDAIIEISDATIVTGLTLTSNTITFKTVKNYGLLPYDVVAIVNKDDNKRHQYRVDKYRQENTFFLCEATLIGEETPSSTNKDDFWFFKHNLDVPEYAYMLPDGTGRHLWRDVVKPSALSFSSDIYNTPFTNGAFYHHTNITFPVRRQDPFGTFGMYATKNGLKLENNFEIPSTEIDVSGDEYIFEADNTNSCF